MHNLDKEGERVKRRRNDAGAGVVVSNVYVYIYV